MKMNGWGSWTIGIVLQMCAVWVAGRLAGVEGAALCALLLMAFNLGMDALHKRLG